MEILKILNRRTAADKALRDKAFNIIKNLKFDGYQHILASMVYKCFHKKTSGKGIENENISNKRLAEKVHKPVISKCNKKRVQSPFIDNLYS